MKKTRVEKSVGEKEQGSKGAGLNKSESKKGTGVKQKQG
jgi:hypothetical protein